ncbi:MAG: polysaccharide deacetylase family protein [Bacteroidota bacterium]
MLFDASRLAPLPTCVEVLPVMAAKARYALVELLRPLGLRPTWTDREGLSGGGLYYGVAPTAAPARALRLRHHASTAAFFAAQQRYEARAATTLRWDEEDWPVLFPLDGEALSSEPFEGADLVASAFYWLSGWHEATTRQRDAHGRFPYAASLHAELDHAAATTPAMPTVLRPVVDAYRERLAAALAEQGVAFERLGWRTGARQPAERQGAVCLTYDIDHWRRRRLGVAARALRGIGSWRGLVGPDPFQHGLDLLLDPVEALGGHATVFLKMSADAAEDVPYRAREVDLRRFTRRVLESGGEVGLHPGYFAHDHVGRLLAERDRLARLVGQPVRAVRQHYLRHDAVRTPRLQAAAGFYLDSTLGFSAHEGFRRATTMPVQLYDLDAEAPLDLWALPVHAMDTTLFQHRALAPEAVCEAFRQVVAQVQRFGGVAVLLWHNTVGDALLHPHQAATYTQVLEDTGAAMPLLTLTEAVESWQ